MRASLFCISRLLFLLLIGSSASFAQEGKTIYPGTLAQDQGHITINPEVKQIAMQLFREHVPRQMFHEREIPLGDHWDISLGMRWLDQSELTVINTNMGQLTAFIRFMVHYEINYGKITYRSRITHPKKGLGSALLKKVRQNKRYLINAKHHEDFTGSGTIVLNIYPNILGPEYEHVRTRVEDRWYGTVAAYANFWEVSLREITYHKLRPRFQQFAEALADTLRARPKLLYRRIGQNHTERAWIYDELKEDHFPFRVRDMKRVRSYCPKLKGHRIDWQGTWQIKFYTRPVRGRLGEYKVNINFVIDNTGRVQLWYIENIDPVVNIFPQDMDLQAEFYDAVEEWRVKNGYDRLSIKIYPVEGEHSDYMLQAQGNGPGQDMIFPVYARSRRKAYLLTWEDRGDILLMPLRKISDQVLGPHAVPP